MKVGRAALDEDAIRLLEELNPEVDFDWTRILKGGAPVEEARQPGVHDRRSTDRPRWPDRRRKDERRPPQPPMEQPGRAPEWTTPAATEISGGRASSAPEAQRIPDHPEEPPPLTDAPPTAAHARLGSEGVSRLRGRYAEVLARITERVPDVARREELKSRAERLNPDSWVTDAEVTAGLEEYEAVFESLRAVVGRRKRRQRRGSRRAEQEGGLPVEGHSPASGPGETASREEAPGPEEDSDAEDF